MGFISRSIAFLMVLLLSPLFFIITILLLLFQGKPVFFQQKRVGYKYTEFNIIKFRTMILNRGHLVTKKNDIRITPLGKFLRRSKLDEIPQLFNIIRGDMRFIGPRPEIPKYFHEEHFEFLKKIKPGISDYSSIIFRNEDQILDDIGGEDAYEKLLPIKIKLAYYYAKKKSFLLDLSLVVGTIIAIFLPNYYSKNFLIPVLITKIKGLEPFIRKHINKA